MRVRRSVAVLLALGLGLAAASSGGYGVAAGSDFETEWDALIAAAQDEGEIVFVSGPTGVEDDGALYEHFGEVFGLEVTIIGGPTEDVTARIFAERDQGIYDYDIGSLGNSGVVIILEAGIAQPLEPLLFHPEATDRSTGWRMDHIPWVDQEATYCTNWAVRAMNNFMWLFYNTENVSEEDLDSLQSWSDVLDPRWTGRISIGTISEGEQSNYRTAAWLALGEEWFDRLFREQQPRINLYGAAREQADGLARGDYDLVLFPSGSDVAMSEAIDDGLPIALLDRTMEEGSGREPIQRLCVFDRPAHPNAARLFANWVLTKEGQEAFNLYTGRSDRASLRDDVPQGNISDEVWALAADDREPITETNTEEYALAEQESIEFVQQVVAELGLVPGG